MARGRLLYSVRPYGLVHGRDPCPCDVYPLVVALAIMRSSFNYRLVYISSRYTGHTYRHNYNYRLVLIGRCSNSRTYSLLIVYSYKIVYRLVCGRSRAVVRIVRSKCAVLKVRPLHL